MQRKNEVTIVFAFFTRQKQFFSKTLKISAPDSFFPKKSQNFSIVIVDFFNKFYQLEMTILKSKIEFKRMFDENMKI